MRSLALIGILLAGAVCLSASEPLLSGPVVFGLRLGLDIDDADTSCSRIGVRLENTTDRSLTVGAFITEASAPEVVAASSPDREFAAALRAQIRFTTFPVVVFHSYQISVTSLPPPHLHRVREAARAGLFGS